MLHHSSPSWQNRHMLTSTPNFSLLGASPDHASPTAPGIVSACFLEMSMMSSKGDGVAGPASGLESTGQWPMLLGSEAKSPLAQFAFFKNLSEKKTTRDGQTPKRRGPKPDSKPALTRRQELNRQAQRTHRERKETYIKALEQEVIRLKDTFVAATRERDSFAEENRRLREILVAHGISFDLSTSSSNSIAVAGNRAYDRSSGDGSGSISTGFTSPPQTSHHQASLSPDKSSQPAMSVQQQSRQGSRQPQGRLDFDQIGIDFVLTLERPCMDHMQMLMVRACDADEAIGGHALMATTPPAAHIAQRPEEKYPHQMPCIQTPDLVKLLDLSNRLPLDGEITPIMAWVMVLRHERVVELTKGDIELIKGELLAKVRCYGFGAVLEEFEVQDALITVLAGKSTNDKPMTFM